MSNESSNTPATFKCHQCGLVNPGDQTKCRRCQTSLDVSEQPIPFATPAMAQPVPIQLPMARPVQAQPAPTSPYYPYPPHTSSQQKTLTRFFNFEEFVTARIIKVLFLLGTVFILVCGTSMFFLAITSPLFSKDSNTPLINGVGLISIIIGTLIWAILWRIVCEMSMVIFKINDNLQAIRDRQQ